MEAEHSPWPWGTMLFAGAWLVATAWWAVFRDGWGIVASMLLSLAMIGLLLLSIILLIGRSRKAVYRCLFVITSFVLFLPILKAGSLLREELFLLNLPYYQQVVDQIGSGKAKPIRSCLVSDTFLLQKNDDSSFTLYFLSRDSSAIGHSGFLYQSNNDPATVQKKKPDIGLVRLAPRWYEWGT